MTHSNYDFKEKSIIFCGADNKSLTVLSLLFKSKIKISAFILKYNHEIDNFKKSLLKLSKKFNFEVMSPKNINSKKSLKNIKKLKPYMICNWGHNQLFGKELIQIPNIGCLNLHPGLLPNGRGSGAIQGEIINSKKLGWTCHFMDTKFDRGFIYKKFNKNFNYKKYYLDQVHKKMLIKVSEFYANCIVNILVKKNTMKHLKKIKNFGRYYPRYSPGDNVIDWNENSEKIIFKVRSRSPEKLSIIYLNKMKKKYFVKKVSKSNVKNYKFVNGQVLDKDAKRGILVKTNDNAIWINEGSYNKKKFSTPKFKIGTNFFCNSSGTTLDLIERINFLEKKISKLNIK